MNARAVSRAAGYGIRAPWKKNAGRRAGLTCSYSTTMDQEASSTLPLSGYRVLDMTRVLAGVS
jgi:hypothetical protein